ncbi:hypothetical protein TNCV_331621 [Trichonephila clavipes]|nr:hypothetical protein TNCV_331621 [Trichonephila clavipes]
MGGSMTMETKQMGFLVDGIHRNNCPRFLMKVQDGYDTCHSGSSSEPPLVILRGIWHATNAYVVSLAIFKYKRRDVAQGHGYPHLLRYPNTHW